MALDEFSIRHVTWRIENGASIASFFASHGAMDRTDPNGGKVPSPSFWGPIEREGTPDLFSCWWMRLLSHPDPHQIFLHRVPLQLGRDVFPDGRWRFVLGGRVRDLPTHPVQSLSQIPGRCGQGYRKRESSRYPETPSRTSTGRIGSRMGDLTSRTRGMRRRIRVHNRNPLGSDGTLYVRSSSLSDRFPLLPDENKCRRGGFHRALGPSDLAHSIG